MFTRIRDFIYRHKKKLIIGGILLVGSSFLSRYAQRKLIEWQEKKTREYLEITRKSQHFESTERTCNQTILALHRSLTEAIQNLLSTEHLISKLKTSPDNRIELWNEIKIIAFTRIVIAIYASVILVAILRVQLNLIGGYIFKDVDNITEDIQQKYLSLCQGFLNDGLNTVLKNIQDKVEAVLSKIDLKQKMSLQDVELLFWSVQAKICNDSSDPLNKLSQLITDTNSSNEPEIYKTVILETIDLLDSEEIRSICNSNISRGYACLIDSIAEYYTDLTANDSEFVNPNKTQIPMAKLIPIVNGVMLSKNKDSKNFSDSLIQQLILNEQFKKLGANIYEAFCEDSIA